MQIALIQWNLFSITLIDFSCFKFIPIIIMNIPINQCIYIIWNNIIISNWSEWNLMGYNLSGSMWKTEQNHNLIMKQFYYYVIIVNINFEQNMVWFQYKYKENMKPVQKSYLPNVTESLSSYVSEISYLLYKKILTDTWIGYQI